MKKTKALLSLSFFALMVMLLSSFSPKLEKKEAAIVNYAWYDPAGQFIAWSTLPNAEIVSDADTNPTGGTLVLIGYTNGGFGITPTGDPVYRLYQHP
jgi:hypothetical protein